MLTQTDYNESYFNGSHAAGYSRPIKRWNVNQQGSVHGEYWKDFAQNLLTTYSLGPNTKVLEVGCANGLVVESLRELGIDCYGVDWSSYALGLATPAVSPYLSSVDAVNDLRSTYGRNEFDVVFSLQFLNCVSDADMPGMVSDLNWITKFQQFHTVSLRKEDWTDPDTGYVKKGNTHLDAYYNMKASLNDWLTFGWDSGTIIGSPRLRETVTKA